MNRYTILREIILGTIIFLISSFLIFGIPILFPSYNNVVSAQSAQLCSNVYHNDLANLYFCSFPNGNGMYCFVVYGQAGNTQPVSASCVKYP